MIFLFDCGNTLLDNDRVQSDLGPVHQPPRPSSTLGDLVGYDLPAFLGGGTDRRMG